MSHSVRVCRAMARAAVVERLEGRVLFAVDLTVASLSVDVTTAYYGTAAIGAFTVEPVLRNLGTTTPAGIDGIEGHVYLTPDRTLGNGNDYWCDYIWLSDDELPAAGRTETLISHFVGFVNADEIPDGTYYVGLVLDPLNDLAESSKGNNSLVSTNAAITVVNDAWESTGDYIRGTAGDDIITIRQEFYDGFVTINGVTKAAPWGWNHIPIDAGAGNDKIVADASVVRTPLRLLGGYGNDTIIGGETSDTILGGAGKDRIAGRGGNDSIRGNGGHDWLYGDAGADRLYGMTGNDLLYGGGSGDRLYSGGGIDALYGDSGNDWFVARDGGVTSLFGSSGSDTAQTYDPEDVLSAVEWL